MRSHRNITVGREHLSVTEFSASGRGFTAIALHGAGKSTKERCFGVCEFLQRRGIACLTFDYSGAGESSSNSPSGLKKRFDEARSVIKHYFNGSPVIIYAFSMSGQIAIDLAVERSLNVSAIVLFNPGLYDPACAQFEFGPAFTACLKRPESWRDTTANTILPAFTGKVVLVRSALDDVIPPGVFDLIENLANRANFRKIVVSNAPHQIGKWISDDTERSVSLLNQILVFLHSDTSDIR